MPVISQHLAASRVQTYTESKMLASKVTQLNLDFCFSLSLLPSSFTFLYVFFSFAGHCESLQDLRIRWKGGRQILQIVEQDIHGNLWEMTGSYESGSVKLYYFLGLFHSHILLITSLYFHQVMTQKTTAPWVQQKSMTLTKILGVLLHPSFIHAGVLVWLLSMASFMQLVGILSIAQSGMMKRMTSGEYTKV